MGNYGRLSCMDAILELIVSIDCSEIPLSDWKENHWEQFRGRLGEVKAKLCRKDAIKHVGSSSSKGTNPIENEEISSLDLFTSNYDDLLLKCILQQTMSYIRIALCDDYEEDTESNEAIV